MTGDEIDLFLIGAGDVEDRGGDDGFALEGIAPAVLGAVEVAERQHPLTVFALDHDDIGHIDFQRLGLMAALVNVEVADLDLAPGAAPGGVNIFAQQPVDVAVGLRQFLVGVIVGDGDDDADVAFEPVEVGFGLGGKRMPAALGEIEPPGVVQRDVIEPAEEGQKQDRLQEQVAEPDPAGGAKTVGEVHAEGIRADAAGTFARRPISRSPVMLSAAKHPGLNVHMDSSLRSA